MINALRVDIRRYLMTNGFVILVAFMSIVQPVAIRLAMMGTTKLMHDADSVNMLEFSSYTSMAGLYLAVVVTMFLHTEAGEGIIRNKIISGKKRHEILFSYCMVNAMLAAILQTISVLVTAFAGLCTKAAFEVTCAEVFRFTIVSILAGVAVSTFYTAIYLCFCTRKAAIALPVCMAIIMKILMFVIADALYTESGIPKVSGITLMIYKGFDRFVPFAHLTGTLRWDNVSYLIGSLGLIAFSLVIGILAFSKKDMK